MKVLVGLKNRWCWEKRKNFLDTSKEIGPKMHKTIEGGVQSEVMIRSDVIRGAWVA